MSTFPWPWVVSAALAACASAPTARPELQAPDTARLEVTVVGFENDEGQALMSLFLDDAGWPDDPDAAFVALSLPIRERTVVAAIDDVPPGSVAVAVFHDEDVDGELDQNFLGIPREDYGFSRDARGRFGPPGFDDARLEIEAGESLPITIEVR